MPRKYHSEPVQITKFGSDSLSGDPSDSPKPNTNAAGAEDSFQRTASYEKSESKTTDQVADLSTLEINVEDEAFSLGYIPLNIFAKKLKNAIQKANDHKVKLKTIDFGKNGHVTDVLIKNLVLEMGKKKLSKITSINLEGCSIVTDVGLHWLLQSLSKNKLSIQVNINGCTEIKDGGLATLACSSNIGYVEAMATSASHFRQAGNTKGCPFLMDPGRLKTVIKKESYVVVIPLDTKQSLSVYLTSKKAKERLSFLYHKAVKFLDWDINIAELQRDHVLFEHMMPLNPVHVIIPFDASCSIQDLKEQISDTIAHVLSKEQINPKHSIKKTMTVGRPECFMNRLSWNMCTFALDGTLRNISDNPNVAGAVISYQPLSRTNSYFEVQCVSCQPETGLILGILHDSLITERFPLKSRKRNGGVSVGFDLEVGAVYGFGIKGQWESEYVPGDDAIYYHTKNGVEVENRNSVEQPHIGLFPAVSVIGTGSESVKLMNYACPPEAIIQQWKQQEQFWTPGYIHKVLCDDQGVLSFAGTKIEEANGLMLCQEEITKNCNTFAIKILETSSGVITMGVGPEDYAQDQQPGWGKMSVALHGDNGKIYKESGQGIDPDTGKCLVWKNGDEIKAVVKNLNGRETIQLDDVIRIEFYVNAVLVATVKHQLTGGTNKVRFVFMVGLRGSGVKIQILNHRPVYLPTPPRMNMLTMGRSDFMNIYDNGGLVYRKFDQSAMSGLFLSKTPFNSKMTYFEIKVISLGDKSLACIGFGYRNYPVNTFLGLLPGSVGYLSKNENIYSSTSAEAIRFGSGDTVGCGIEAESAKFREDGSLENQQSLRVYFNKNGKKVHEVEFEYLSDGIYPGVCLSHQGDEVIILNYYPGPESGEQPVEEIKNEKVTSGKQEKFVEGCRFTLVGVGNEGSDPQEKVQALQQALEKELEFPILSSINEHIQQMESNPRMMNLQGQQLCGSLYWQKECLERFLANKSRLRYMAVDVSSGKGHKELIDHIVQVCEMELINHNSYYDLHESIQLALQKITSILSKEKILAADKLMELVGIELRQNGRVFEAAIQHLHAKGHLISTPVKKTLVAVDIKFAEALAHACQTPSDTPSSKATPCIGEGSKIWNRITDVLQDIEKFSPSKLELLGYILQYFGMMKIPCMRSNKDDPMFCYCTPATVGDLPVKLADFTEDNEDTVLIQREYHFLYSNPSNIFSVIISRCLLLFRALAISSKWSVFQSGAAQTVIYIKEGLKVETRCFLPSKETDTGINSDTKYQVEEYAFNIFCIFLDLIDDIIAKLKVKVTYTEQTPQNFVNVSIGCIHKWSLSRDVYRQTLCTLCSQCCEKGQNCLFNGLAGQYQYQCGCNTAVTGCTDCGICQSCADVLWSIRSFLRPNLEVAGYRKMKSNILIPLNATTYDEVEFTNLGAQQTPICLKVSTGQYSLSSTSDISGPLTKMFPGTAMVFPNQETLQEHMAQHLRGDISRLMTFEQGDTVTIKLDPVKRDATAVTETQEEPAVEITPVYFTSICRDTTVWHDTGIVAYTKSSPAASIGQFISASPLTAECPSFSFRVINSGKECQIAIGVCHNRYPSGYLPGWIQDSYAYHADDGGIFTGDGFTNTHVSTCTVGDVMKCQLDFENETISFYKNDTLMYKLPQIHNISSYHAAVGFKSDGEAVCLLEKEPWQMTVDEEPALPEAFDSYKYGNMLISPRHTLTLAKNEEELTAWLLIHNPSKSIVGYKIVSSFVSEPAGYLEPSMSLATRFMVSLEQVEASKERNELFLDIHWFHLESNRDYKDINIDQIYAATTPESLLKHRLKVKITEVSAAHSELLKLASEEPDDSDHYLAEVFKNGISVEKYWLKGGNYVCCLPQKCNVLIRYPKFPTLCQPNWLQRGMRIVVDISSDQKDLCAEAVIEDVAENGNLKLQYSEPGMASNTNMEVNITSPELMLQDIANEQVQNKNSVKDSDGSDAAKDKLHKSEKAASLNIIGFQPRGNVAASKRAYMFPPLHLLTDAGQTAINYLDSAWKVNSLSSVAQCKTLPTRLPVQEFQISQLIGTKLDWLKGANPSHKFDFAFAFLPVKLGHKELCYPRLPNMFKEIGVHRLCFLTDQMHYSIHLAKNYNIILDAPLHFVNVSPVTPSAPLTAEVMYASSFNSWTYSTLYCNKLYLPLCDKIFPEGRPDFSRIQLEQLMKSLIHVYAAQCHIFAEQHGGIMFQQTSENGTEIVTKAIEHMDNDIIKQTDKAELSSDVLMRKPFRSNIYCKTHQWCLPGTNVVMKEKFDFRNELFSPYQETVNLLYREMIHDASIRSDFFSFFSNLQYIKLSSCENLKHLPEGISKCVRLEMVSIKNSAVEVLPADLFEVPCLKYIHCVNLKIQTLPTRVVDPSSVTELILSNLLLTSVPGELGKLSNLEHLNLNSNPLQMLPMELKSLTRLKTLLLCGIPWIVLLGSKVEMPLDQFEDFLRTNSSLQHYIGKEKLTALFHEFDHNKNSRLDENEIASLNSHLFWNVPRLGSSCIGCNEYGGIPPVVFLLSSLEVMHLDFQAITSIPVHICRLKNLKVLSISNNPLLESLPGSLGHLPNLKSLKLVSNPTLRTPPNEVVSRGFTAVQAYLKRLAGGFIECRRTKLMLVGLGGAGKTSLLRALMSPDKKTTGTKGEDITNGIDILPWTLQTSDGVEVTFNTWDFAGQTLYYNTHQFFLSKRAVYLLLWSTRQGFEHAGLEFWLSSIASHAPKTPVFIVGTHCDQVPKADIPMSDLQERYPQIAGFHFVSAIEGIGIAELEKELLRMTLQQKNMGEKVPKVWLNMEAKILATRNSTSVLPWKTIQEFGTEVGIYDEKDIREATQFLHELGTVQYFDNEFLREQVIINPQWIVNVMSCVVSVKNSPIQEHHGRFYHTDMPVIWQSYPRDLHNWLLRLTEEFDLTFPLPDDKVNIVPCLLPHEVPKELNWPVADITQNMKETKLIYRFTYLPAGLFNRAQVRLFQLSDGKMIWKRGSLLTKNKHQALILQTSDSELQVKVKGPRPENIIFLIHEIIESLIQESFHGVVYEFLVPCPDCILREGTLEPSMFESSLVKRAKEHKAPFLQCRKYFHTISMAQLYEIMPSDSSTDIDAQLQNSLTKMQQLNSSLSTDVVIIYSSKDAVADNDSSNISPKQIRKDLEDAGFTCWFSDRMDSVSIQDVMVALKNCKVVVALLSDDFESDEKCRDLLFYTMESLGKDYVIVVIRDSLSWEDTNLGMRIGKQEEKVMMRNTSRYDARVNDMITAVQGKLENNQQQRQEYPSVFISYCWSNSKHAHARGTKCSPEALGWGDPREIKLELEKRGLTCWLDFDKHPAGKGLFSNIAEAIQNSQVLVACASNEYAKSDNCMMELRFAVFNMELPVVVAAVGTGKEWKQTEVGILMQRSKAEKFDFQKDNPKEYDELGSHIRKMLSKSADPSKPKKAVMQAIQSLQDAEKNKEQKKMNEITPYSSIFQEEYELMQRKFMRHIVSYVSSMDSVPAPRLIVVDFEKRGQLSKKSNIHSETENTSKHTRSKSMKKTFSQKSATRSSRLIKQSAENAENKWEDEAFCLKILCEDEKGWHVCENIFPVEMNDEFKNMIKGCSIYLARMYAILRQSAVTLNIFDGPLGSKFTSWIEQRAADNINFLDSYTALRSKLVDDAAAQGFLCQLHRCHLPTGKIYWLCTPHSAAPRITHISTEAATRSEVGRVLFDEDVKLKENLESSDTYKQKKKAKSPSAGIILPQSLDTHSTGPAINERSGAQVQKGSESQIQKSSEDQVQKNSESQVQKGTESQENGSSEAHVPAAPAQTTCTTNTENTAASTWDIARIKTPMNNGSRRTGSSRLCIIL